MQIAQTHYLIVTQALPLSSSTDLGYNMPFTLQQMTVRSIGKRGLWEVNTTFDIEKPLSQDMFS